MGWVDGYFQTKKVTFVKPLDPLVQPKPGFAERYANRLRVLAGLEALNSHAEQPVAGVA
jgi:hypothetical protein